MNGVLSGISSFLSNLFKPKLVSPVSADQNINSQISDYVSQSAGPTNGITSPSPMPTGGVDKVNLPPITSQTPVFNPQVSTESARPIIKQIIEGYQPKTPDITPDWKSPLVDYIDLLASLSGQYGLDPRLLPGLAIGETQLMRPGASGTLANNPYNVMQPGTQTLHQYPSIDEALRQYAAGIAGPTSDPSGQGLERYGQFSEVNPQTTLEQFISGYHNPSDNPQQQIQLLLNVLGQLGL